MSRTRSSGLRKRADIVVALMGKRGDLRSQDLAVNVARLGFLGKDDRHAEMLRGDASDADARSLDGQDFGDAPVAEAAIELLAQLIDERDIRLMVQKGIDLEHLTVLDAAAFQNSLFQ